MDKPSESFIAAIKSIYEKTEEPVELNEAFVNHRDYASKGKMHSTMAKRMTVGKETDFYEHGTGDKKSGIVKKNTGKEVHIKAHSEDGRVAAGPLHKFKVSDNLDEDVISEVESQAERIKKSNKILRKIVKKNQDKMDRMKSVSEEDLAESKPSKYDIEREAAENKHDNYYKQSNIKKLKKDPLGYQSGVKEEEQLDELSKNTLANYVIKAHRSVGNLDHTYNKTKDNKQSKKIADKSTSRSRNITKAVNKLAKEDVNINESFSTKFGKVDVDLDGNIIDG